MTNEYVLATNDDGDLAVRTVSATEASGITDTQNVITRTEDGKLAIRTVGSGGGDQHNLGYYATQAALEEAHPTAEAGDWAIVGSTDTVWIWDTDNNQWVDSDQKGQVTSVNGQTGDVTITASDLGAVAKAGDTMVGALGFRSGSTTAGYIAAQSNYIRIGTSSSATSNDLFIAPNSKQIVLDTSGWKIGAGHNKLDTVGTQKINNGSDITVPAVAGSMAVQVSSLPTASSTLEGQIYQYIGATDSTYTNGHFYKCVSDGQSPATYSWEEVSLGGGGGLPDQTGQSGKFLTTDGTDASWGTINALQNTATGTDSLTVSGIATATTGSTNIGVGATIGGAASYGVATGNEAKVIGSGGVAIGAIAESAYDSVAIGRLAKATGGSCIQLGSRGTNNETGTFKVALTNASYVTQNYKLLDYDGTVPTARLTKVNTTATLAAGSANWTNNEQTVTVSGVKADSVVFVSPDPTSASDYASAGILCTAQAADSLTFTCTTTPSNAITVNVVCM